MSVIEIAAKKGHTISLFQGPCDSPDHVGQFCRRRWFTCSCMDDLRIEMMAVRHDVDDSRAIEWASESAQMHLESAVEYDL